MSTVTGPNGTPGTAYSNLMAGMNPAAAASDAGSVAQTQERFMTLLVTQMKNQDPLNPLDNAQVTSQLAQLSTVTGINQLNSTLEAMMGNYQAGQSLQAANMIGHGVLVPGSQVDLSAGKSVFGIDLPEAVDSAKVTILDAAGNAVWSTELKSLEAGSLALTWDGKTTAGEAAADGQYRLEVKATRGGEKVAANPLSFGMVASVASSAQGVRLNLGAQGMVALADVRQIL
jgi:flagellar basal-body rod modification protein FlgD